jgi:cytochrome c oxidase assembly protein subunit 15
LSSNRAFAVAGNLGLTTTLLAFGLIVIGSVVRTTGSGLSCPDWPLCQGRLIPPLEYHVLIEWFHRLIAMLVSLMVVITAAWTFSQAEVRARLGGRAALTLVLLLTQVMLGALTVWKLLDPSTVNWHLAVAILLFGVLLSNTLTAHAAAEGDEEFAQPTRSPWSLLGAVLFVANLMTFTQAALLGGAVSSRHAGLVCPEWPTCNGEWFPPLEGLVGLQMMHRYTAYGLVALMLVIAALTRSAADAGVRAGGQLALTLVVAQVIIGVCNVFLGTPPWLSAAHLATAVALLGVLIATQFRVQRMPGPIAESPASHPVVGGVAAR